MESWSERKTIPSVSAFLAEQQKRSDAQMTSPTTSDKNELESSDNATEKQKLMEKARHTSSVRAQDLVKKGSRTVIDPVTGTNVVINDSKPISKTRDETGNIVMQPFPDPIASENLAKIYGVVSNYTLTINAALAAIWAIVIFFSHGGYIFLAIITGALGSLAFSVYASHGIVARKLEKELERIRIDMERQRGRSTFVDPIPESTEWLNALVATVWKVLSPDLFTGLIDTIEDVLQASLPSFVDAVKIADFTLGKNALRIVSMRGLPDYPRTKGYPREEWIDQGVKSETQGDAASQIDLDQSGDYVNLEVSVAFAAPPGQTKATQTENRISLLMEFFLGAYDLARVPVPIYIAVEEIVATVRLRLQIISEAPFVRNCTVTLMGVPHVEASAIPMTRLLPNVLDLPLVSSFVQSSIAAAASIYVAPKSMTINLKDLLSGDGVKRDTSAIGALYITLHHAEGLSAQDSNGFSDPYIVAAYEKYGKPLYSTRIISRDLNPVYEETFLLLVTEDEVKSEEKLTLQLWDSDRSSADDLVGRVSIPLADLMKRPGKQNERKDGLTGFQDGETMAGTLSWSVGYYEKIVPQKKKNSSTILPNELRETVKEDVKPIDPVDLVSSPPDERYPTGILSIIVHHINQLEIRDLTGNSGKDREGEAGQDTDQLPEETGNLPSGYAEIIINDAMVFKTRVKQYTTMPFFEAGTEVLVRHLPSTVVRICVRDSRVREHDPILGIVTLPLAELLRDASQVTRLFAIQGGVGFGRVNVSVLFKPIDLSLPRNLSGWDTGTACVLTHVKVEPVSTSFHWKEKKLSISTTEAKQKLTGSSAIAREDGGLEWEVEESIRLPTYNRFASFLYFEYGGGVTVGPLGTSVEAYAALPLADLVDDEPSEIRIPIVVSKHFGSLKANIINKQCEATHEFEIVGWLTTTVLLDSGLDADHEEYAQSQSQTKRHLFETHEQAEGFAAAARKNAMANDDGFIDKEEAAAIKRAHSKELASQHRGPMQFRAVRTAKWSKDSVKYRLLRAKDKLLGTAKEETVASEMAP